MLALVGAETWNQRLNTLFLSFVLLSQPARRRHTQQTTARVSGTRFIASKLRATQFCVETKRFALFDAGFAPDQPPIRRIQRDLRADGEGGVMRDVAEREV